MTQDSNPLFMMLLESLSISLMFITTDTLFLTVCSADHRITYITVYCWNNFTLGTTKKLFKTTINIPICFSRICNFFQYLKMETVILISM